MNEIPTCTYEESCEDGIGKLIIGGLVLPKNKTDPLEMIWSACRKKSLIEYDIDAYIDVSQDANGYIICSFHPNFAVGEVLKMKREDYQTHFNENFPWLMMEFTEAIDAFFSDYAFTKYKRALVFCKNENTKVHMIKGIMNDFLKKMNLKK